MKAAAILVGVVAAASLAAVPTAGQPPAAFVRKSDLVDVRYGEWTDAARGGRVVPYKLYLPKAASGPLPVIIHSHGLGGSREASTYILQDVAAAGFAVVALQHAGSDSALLANAGGASAEEALARNSRGAMNPQVAQARYGDVPFAIGQIARDPALKDRVDLSRLGMSGHSYGALSTLVAVGQRVLAAPAGVSFAEPRIKAAIAYSPNKPRGDDPVAAFTAVKTPMLHFTGTEDATPFDLERTPFERTAAYQAITGADQFLIILDRGDHAVFGGRRTVTGQFKPTDAAHMEVVKAESIRFWRAYLARDGRAATEMCALPARLKPQGEAFVKASRCGPPTPIRPLSAGD